MTSTKSAEEWAAKWAENYIEEQYADNSYDEDNLADDLKTALLAGLEAGEERAGKWISVKEKLPEKSGNYLVVYEYGGISMVDFSSRRQAWNAYDWDYDNPEENFMHDVTHWMELPPPPAKEEEK